MSCLTLNRLILGRLRVLTFRPNSGGLGKKPDNFLERFNEENDKLYGQIRNTSEQVVRNRSEPSISQKSLSGSIKSSSIPGKEVKKFPFISIRGDNTDSQALGSKFNALKSSSVSKILNETMSDASKAALNRWRQEKIKELGEEGFTIYQASLFRRGHNLHAAARSLLSGEKRFEESDIPPENEGYWKSMHHVFSKISDAEVLERAVTHPLLKYHGIVDCICKINENIVVLDWKTSEKKKFILEHLYDNPLQVAAYIGAVNSDPAFSNQNLNKGTVVVAYENGDAADIFTFDCGKYWNLWLQRLYMFHFGKKLMENETIMHQSDSSV